MGADAAVAAGVLVTGGAAVVVALAGADGCATVADAAGCAASAAACCDVAVAETGSPVVCPLGVAACGDGSARLPHAAIATARNPSMIE